MTVRIAKTQISLLVLLFFKEPFWRRPSINDVCGGELFQATYPQFHYMKECFLSLALIDSLLPHRKGDIFQTWKKSTSPPPPADFEPMTKQNGIIRSFQTHPVYPEDCCKDKISTRQDWRQQSKSNSIQTQFLALSLQMIVAWFYLRHIVVLSITRKSYN